MARTTRAEVFEHDEVGVYHLYNRVVRRCFLCGVDPVSGKDFSHRREMIVRRLQMLDRYFAIDVLAFAVLSNHFHLVVRNRPDLVQQWDDHEVAWRWLMICPARRHPDGSPIEPTEAELAVVLADKPRLLELRQRLSNPSWLMGRACQYIARRCNQEDQQSGRFFEERFKMKRLLDESAVLACMAYVDLNPVRAGLTDRLDGYAEVSIRLRLRRLDGSLPQSGDWLAPLTLAEEADRQPVQTVGSKASTVEVQPIRQQLGCLPIDLETYVDLLSWLGQRDCPAFIAPTAHRSKRGEAALRALGLDTEAFADVISHYEHRFRTAVGCPASIDRERHRRHRQRLHAPGRHALTRQPVVAS